MSSMYIRINTDLLLAPMAYFSVKTQLLSVVHNEFYGMEKALNLKFNFPLSTLGSSSFDFVKINTCSFCTLY